MCVLTSTDHESNKGLAQSRVTLVERASPLVSSFTPANGAHVRVDSDGSRYFGDTSAFAFLAWPEITTLPVNQDLLARANVLLGDHRGRVAALVWRRGDLDTGVARAKRVVDAHRGP
jgi:hypothetical protein